MTTRKHTKKALFASVISLMLCVVMLVGSTFAWFTDNATTSVNTIEAGTLKIAIVDNDGKELTEALRFVNADNSTNIKWEPNAKFQTGEFYIQNNGNLHLTYKIEINNTEISYNKLNEVIEFTLIDAAGKEYDLTAEQDLAPKAKSGALKIQGHMSPDADNSYQGLTMDGVSITVYAKQATEEKDMTDDQYDKDAEYDGEVVTVKTADEFTAAFAALEEDQVITLTGDIDMTDKAWTPVNNKSFTLNGNDHTITGLSGPLVGTTAAKNYTVKNVTFKNITSNGVYGNTSNGGIIGYADTCAYINMTDVTIDGATIGGAEYIGGFVGYTSGYGVDTNGPVNASHNFTNCTIKNATLTSNKDGSIGGLIGHAGSNPATTTRINGFTYENLTLSQSETRLEKQGYMIGTANVGVVYVTDDDITADNLSDYIGRFVPQGTGKLVINGQEIAAFDGKGN